MATASEVKAQDPKAEAAAEKAYAAAAETVPAAPADKAPAKPAPAPVAAKPVAAPKPAAKRKTAAKTVAKAPVAKAKKIKPVAAKAAPVKAKAKPAAKPAISSITKLKDTIMSKTNTEDFTARVKDTMVDMQGRAKAALEKGTAVFGDVGEFSKGNLEAVVESTKILAAGMQDLGRDYVADSKSAFETMTADMKELVAVKSPTDFFKLQGEIMRRSFDSAVALGSKRSETLVKLANEAYRPLSSRVSLVVEKVKKAA